MNPQSIIINKKKIYSFKSEKELLEYIKLKRCGILVSMNIEALALEDPEFTDIINNNIGYADGIGAVFALKLRKVKQCVKIPGVELWKKIFHTNSSLSAFFLGGSEAVINTTVEKFKIEFSNDVKGFRNGFIEDGNELQDIKNDIIRLKPDIICLAMGQPRQEKIASYLFKHYPALYLCIGGSFDIYSGVKNRAPKILISLGLEWTYRIIKEPFRIKRLRKIPLFILKLLFGRFNY